jgi:integrase
MRATMAVKVKFHKGAWYLFIDHQGRRKAKKIGDGQTALDVTREVREKLARDDLGLLESSKTEAFETYANRWLTNGEGGRKASTQRFYAFNLKLHIIPSLGRDRSQVLRERTAAISLVRAARRAEARLA